MSLNLYKFEWDCGRMGTVEGVFVAHPGAVEKALGTQVYFGEILGKHSEIEGKLEEKDFTVLETSPEFVTEFDHLFPKGFGHNPFNYFE